MGQSFALVRYFDGEYKPDIRFSRSLIHIIAHECNHDFDEVCERPLVGWCPCLRCVNFFIAIAFVMIFHFMEDVVVDIVGCSHYTKVDVYRWTTIICITCDVADIYDDKIPDGTSTELTTEAIQLPSYVGRGCMSGFLGAWYRYLRFRLNNVVLSSALFYKRVVTVDDLTHIVLMQGWWCLLDIVVAVDLRLLLRRHLSIEVVCLPADAHTHMRL